VLKFNTSWNFFNVATQHCVSRCRNSSAALLMSCPADPEPTADLHQVADADQTDENARPQVYPGVFAFL
jgi:hypothetical protein